PAKSSTAAVPELNALRLKGKWLGINQHNSETRSSFRSLRFLRALTSSLNSLRRSPHVTSLALGGRLLTGSNIGDSGNTGDGGKIVGGAIGAHGGIGDSLLIALYACMIFIYGSSWKGEMASEAKRYLDKSSEGSGEVFLGEAGK
ncbi:hypothetical protein Tco_1559496, partial [Tanacetum coccineum]